MTARDSICLPPPCGLSLASSTTFCCWQFRTFWRWNMLGTLKGNCFAAPICTDGTNSGRKPLCRAEGSSDEQILPKPSFQKPPRDSPLPAQRWVAAKFLVDRPTDLSESQYFFYSHFDVTLLKCRYVKWDTCASNSWWEGPHQECDISREEESIFPLSWKGLTRFLVRRLVREKKQKSQTL